MKQVSLGIVDTQFAHLGQDFWAIDKLRHSLDSHYVRHVHKAAYRGFVKRLGIDAFDELAIDFQDVDGQRLQVAWRRADGRPPLVG